MKGFEICRGIATTEVQTASCVPLDSRTSPASSHNIPAITAANNTVTPGRRHRVPVQNNDSNQPHYNGQLSGSIKILPVRAFLRYRI